MADRNLSKGDVLFMKNKLKTYGWAVCKFIALNCVDNANNFGA